MDDGSAVRTRAQSKFDRLRKTPDELLRTLYAYVEPDEAAVMAQNLHKDWRKRLKADGSILLSAAGCCRVMFRTNAPDMAALCEKLPLYNEYKCEDGWPEPDEWRLRRV